MKKLVRPTCKVNLKSYIRNGNNWNSLRGDNKHKIKMQLLEMTNHRCSYCENLLKEHKWHIEHIAPKRSYPECTFNWNNLFCSCDNNDTCGKHKDNIMGYKGDASDLIKPDVEDPSDFFEIKSFDGSFSLKGVDLNKGDNTIKFFNLNAGSLTNFRHNYIKQSKCIINCYQEIFSDDLSDKEKEQFFKEMIDEISELYEEIGVKELGFIQMYLQSLSLDPTFK